MMLDMHPWAGLSDDVRLGVLTEWVTADLVDEVLAECGKRDQKPGALPARFMVYYVLALALFQQDSYDDVAENLGLPRVFRTTELVLFHAASGRFRYSSSASCGVLYPSAEWRRVRLYRSSMYRAISSRAFFLVG